MPDETTDTPKIKEMDPAHRQRVCLLLIEADRSPGTATPQEFIAAYNAVLMKDVLWSLNELLVYRQNEVHR